MPACPTYRLVRTLRAEFALDDAPPRMGLPSCLSRPDEPEGILPHSSDGTGLPHGLAVRSATVPHGLTISTAARRPLTA